MDLSWALVPLWTYVELSLNVLLGFGTWALGRQTPIQQLRKHYSR